MKAIRLSRQLLITVARTRAVSAVREGVIGEYILGVLRVPPHKAVRSANLIFEKPEAAPFGLQVTGNVAALDAIVATFRGILPFAQNL